MFNLTFPKRALQLASIAFVAAASFPVAHAETGQGVATTTRAQPLTRAEVKADVVLWRRAKVDEFGAGEMTPTTHEERAKRLALYQSWRQGPEFQAELQRFQRAERR